MRKKANVVCLILAVLLLLPGGTKAEDKAGRWELIASDDGIDTYRMRHPGTDICTFKGVGFVDAGMEVVGAVIRDIPAYPRWMARCKKAEVLKHIDRNTKILYNVINAPFPYKDRDMVVDNTTFYDLENGTAEITFGLARDYPFPETGEYLRVPELSGRYFLEYFGRHKTRVTYLHKADPGGNIPVLVANRVEIRRYPAMNIKGLREMVRDQAYITAGRQSPEYDLIEGMLASREKVAQVLKNRMQDYVTDPVFLARIFAQPSVEKLVDQMHAAGVTFDSIVEGVIGILSLVSGEAAGSADKSAEAVFAYIADKPLAAFFSMDAFMQEKWLIKELARRQAVLRGLLDRENMRAQRIFHKLLTDETAVRAFIKNDHLAETILTDQSLRTRLWEDREFRKDLLENLGTFACLADFEKMVQERVDGYR